MALTRLRYVLDATKTPCIHPVRLTPLSPDLPETSQLVPLATGPSPRRRPNGTERGHPVLACSGLSNAVALLGSHETTAKPDPPPAGRRWYWPFGAAPDETNPPPAATILPPRNDAGRAARAALLGDETNNGRASFCALTLALETAGSGGTHTPCLVYAAGHFSLGGSARPTSRLGEADLWCDTCQVCRA